MPPFAPAAGLRVKERSGEQSALSSKASALASRSPRYVRVKRKQRSNKSEMAASSWSELLPVLLFSFPRMPTSEVVRPVAMMVLRRLCPLASPADQYRNGCLIQPGRLAAGSPDGQRVSAEPENAKARTGGRRPRRRLSAARTRRKLAVSSRPGAAGNLPFVCTARPWLALVAPELRQQLDAPVGGRASGRSRGNGGHQRAVAAVIAAVQHRA